MTESRTSTRRPRLAELQDGVLTRSQALAAGLSDRVIAAHLRCGRWQRLHPGVYATFSGTPSATCLLWAAVLRSGEDAVLSHQTAARLWDLPAPMTTAIHVTVPRGSPVVPPPGVIVHYSQRVAQARHPTWMPPVTAVEETALDLAAAAATAEDAVAWVLRAVASRRTTPEHLAAALRRRSRMRWRAEIAAALGPANSGLHSILEYRFVHRVERPHGLPAGNRQRLTLRGRRREYSDVAYEDYATLVELDGRAAHPESTRALDTRRDNANLAEGWVTLRYGWAEVSERSCELAAELARTLRRRGWPGALRRCSATCRIPAAALLPAPGPPSVPGPPSAPGPPPVPGSVPASGRLRAPERLPAPGRPRASEPLPASARPRAPGLPPSPGPPPG
jgi:hypothetical protein